MNPDQLRTFFSEATSYLRDPTFQAAEVSYKLCFQGELRPAMEAYRTGDTSALSQLTAALRSPNQNMIDWRLVQPLLDWCERRASNARTALRSLWFGNGSLDKNEWKAFGKVLFRQEEKGAQRQQSIPQSRLRGC